jgi:hypothetical protein
VLLLTPGISNFHKAQIASKASLSDDMRAAMAAVAAALHGCC